MLEDFDQAQGLGRRFSNRTDSTLLDLENKVILRQGAIKRRFEEGEIDFAETGSLARVTRGFGLFF